MKRTTCLLAPLLILAACSPDPSDPPRRPAPPMRDDPKPEPDSRLRVSADGVITDVALGGAVCVFGYDADCVRRCFPEDPLWPACDGAGGQYHYTRQGLAVVLRYGRIDTSQNSACQGCTTSRMVALWRLTAYDQAHIYRPQSCDGKYDFTGNTKDRRWYKTMDSAIEPATADDLPLG